MLQKEQLIPAFSISSTCLTQFIPDYPQATNTSINSSWSPFRCNKTIQKLTLSTEPLALICSVNTNSQRSGNTPLSESWWPAAKVSVHLRRILINHEPRPQANIPIPGTNMRVCLYNVDQNDDDDDDTRSLAGWPALLTLADDLLCPAIVVDTNDLECYRGDSISAKSAKPLRTALCVTRQLTGPEAAGRR